MDLGAIGYLPGAQAISETLAENSIKLIALKGVLEHHLNQQESLSLSDDAIRIMDLMDSLLWKKLVHKWNRIAVAILNCLPYIQDTAYSGHSSAVSLPIVMGRLVGEAAKSSIARSTQPTITIVTVKLTNKWH